MARAATQGRAEPLERSRVRDRRGRVWTIAIVPRAQAEEDDLDFWLSMSPNERLEAMTECLLDSLKIKGRRELPRLRRVYRVTQR